jgi:hypothetical protein
VSYHYIDKKTGKRVSELKWKRSKRQGGTRYVRRNVNGKTAAKSDKSRPEKATEKKTQTQIVSHIVTITVRSSRRNSRTGRSELKSFRRDITVPAPRGAKVKELLSIAKDTLPKKEQYAVDWTKAKGRKITVVEGPETKSRKAHLR